MDRRIAYKIVIDTETCPIDRDVDGVFPSNMWTYDCGWAVVDKRGTVYRTRSFVNADIFLYENVAMTSAYYASKIPQYWEDIKSGKRVLAKWKTIRKTLLADIEEFAVEKVYAHNMRFDYGTLNTTHRWLTKSEHRYFFPYGVQICDTLKMARDILGKMPTYRKFCEENGFMTKNNQVRMTAEIIYRFITRDLEFIENHTGLEDVMIEKEILAYCFRQHKPMRELLWED